MAISKSGDEVFVELITDFNAIKKETGLTVEDNFLYPALGLDSYRDVAPTLVKTGNNKYYVVAKQIEEGNLSANGRAFNLIGNLDVSMIYHGSYFTWESSQEVSEPAPVTQAQALARVLKVNCVTANGDMPLGRYQEFADEFEVTIKPGEKREAKITTYKIDKAGVVAAYSKDRASAVETAIKLLDTISEIASEDKELVKEGILKAKSDKFALLDTLMKKGNLAYVLASSKINVQELTA